MGSLRPEEEWAREVIAHELGVAVVQHDDGTREGMHDLEIEFAGARGAVEVTAAADGEPIALWNELNGRGDRWIEPTLVGGWMVTLLPSARAKRLRKELPLLLMELESSAVEALETLHDSRDGATVAARDLGVASMYQSGTAFPGSIYVTLESPGERTGASVSTVGDPLAVWVGRFLHQAAQRDVREKLGRSSAAERHAFLVVPAFSHADAAVVDLLMRDYPPLPDAAPDLPEEVTHVWAMSDWEIGRGVRWSPQLGWSLFDKLLRIR